VAVDDLPTTHEPLDKPVVIAMAGDAIIHTLLAKVEISIITGLAVVVGFGDGGVALVTADGKRGAVDGQSWSSRRSHDNVFLRYNLLGWASWWGCCLFRLGGG
jgi:hypothetical protein